MFNENGAFFKHSDIFFKISSNNQSVIDKKDLINFEVKYKLKLPNDYKEFLLKYNQAYLQINIELNSRQLFLSNVYFEKENITAFIDCFYNIKSIEDELIKMFKYDLLEDEENFIKQKILPIASSSAGHNDLGIAYGENNYGYIYFWSDSFEDRTFVCKSFKDFIEGYYLIEIDDNGEPIEGAKKYFDLENVSIEKIEY